MKVLLVAINAKYIHSNLAIYTLQAYAKSKGIDVEIAEYTINNYAEEIMADIYRKKPDFLGFSCYIWNISYVTDIAKELHKVLPNMAIWFGGPEVSYESENYLKEHTYVDGIMIGEGEETLCELVRSYEEYFKETLVKQEENNVIESNAELIKGVKGIEEENKGILKNAPRIVSRLKNIRGIVIRNQVNESKSDAEIQIINTGMRPYLDLDEVPFPYNNIDKFANRIIYYESSRGCPYSCSYCMSSIDKRVRFRSMELVKKELKFFIDNNITQVKFVDRTFNCNKQRTLEIWKFIKENDNGITNFHFEISADILSDEEIEMMKDMRPRLIQLEIGVQSTNEKTIDAIKRKMDFAKLSDIVNRINDTNKVHQHLDLIAGLPYEDYESFRLSFNDVYGLRPEQLQLGFLKVLKGSLMHEEAEKYGIVYKSNPVYEVLKTKWLSYDDVLKLKQIEDVLEVYYNSRQFENTMEYLLRFFETPFDMYEHIANYYDENNLFGIKHTRINRYIILLDMLGKTVLKKLDKEYNIARQLLVHDLYLREKVKSRPEFAEDMNIYKDKYNELYKNEEQIRAILPAYNQYDTKQIARMTHIEHYTIDIQELINNKKIIEKDYFILYDYLERNPINYQARIYVF